MAKLIESLDGGRNRFGRGKTFRLGERQPRSAKNISATSMKRAVDDDVEWLNR